MQVVTYTGGEKGGLASSKGTIAYFVDNHSLYTYLDRGSEILITPLSTFTNERNTYIIYNICLK